MKIKEEYTLQHIAGQWVVINTNAGSVNFNKILSLNTSGKFLWEKIEAGTDGQALVSALANEFGINEVRAKTDVDAFIRELKRLGCTESDE